MSNEHVRRHWAQAGNSCRAGGGDETGTGAGAGAGAPGPAVIALGFRLWMTRHPGRAWMGSSDGGPGGGAGVATGSGGASTALRYTVHKRPRMRG